MRHAGEHSRFAFALIALATILLSDTANASNAPITSLCGAEVTSITRNTWSDATLIQRSFGGSRSFSYNTARELVVSSSLEEGTASYGYDRSRGLLSSYSRGDSSLTTYTHDSRGRLTQINYPDATPDLTQSYTPDGLLSTISNGAISRSFTYNASRLLNSETLSVTGGPSFTLGRSYSATQALSTLTYPDTSTISYAPDAYGEPTSAAPFASAVTHHQNGAIASFTYGNSIAHTLTQDFLDRPLRSTDTGVLDYSFGYDGVSNLTSITDNRPGAIDSKTMAYDARSMLTSATAPNAWGAATFTYTLGGDSLTTMNVGANTATFALDAARRLERVTRPGNDVTTFAYDTRGNMTRRGTQILTFDRADRLTGITGGDSYQYDGLDQRTVTTSADGSKNYSFYSSDGELITEVEIPGPNPSDLLFKSGFDPDPNVTTQYYYLSGSLLAKRIKAGLGASATSQTVYIHTDHLGGTSRETNAAGQVIKTERYEPFGKDAAGSTPAGVGYAGHYKDSSGLIYMGARYYDPLTGRFISPDPVGTSTFDGSNFNRYWYANNNPYSMVDPDGREAACVTLRTGCLNGMTAASMKHGAITAVIGVATLPVGGEIGLAIGTMIKSGARTAAMTHGPALTTIATEAVTAGAAIATGTEMGPGGSAVAMETKAVVKAVTKRVDYSTITNPSAVGPGKEFSLRQKVEALELNKAANGGAVKSDLSGTVLTQPKKSEKGVTPDPNEWQFDHKTPKKCGGTNCSSNIQILSRKENRDKSDSQE